METETELKPIYASRKSFYGKAIVINDLNNFGQGTIKLQSYTTIVLSIIITKEWEAWKFNGLYSATTLRHIKEFVRQRAGVSLGIKELREILATNNGSIYGKELVLKYGRVT